MVSARLRVKHTIFIRVDGGNEKGLGMGHIYRCLNFAIFLRTRFKVIFLIKKYPEAICLIKKRGFSVIRLRKNNEFETINSLIHKLKPKLFIADIRDIDNRYIQKIKEEGCSFIYFDDLGRRDLKPDLIINPSPDHEFIDYPKLKSVNYLLGLRYFILNYTGNRDNGKAFAVKRHVKKIAISFGGADPKDCSARFIKLIKYLPERIEYLLVLGPAYKNKNRLIRYVKNNIKKSKVLIKYNIPDLLELFRLSDIAVVSGGDTLLEALHIGIPTLVLPTIWYEDKISEKLKNKGQILKTEQIEMLEDEDILSKMTRLINDYALRLTLHRRSKGAVDNQGAKRIYRHIKHLSFDRR